MKRTPFPYWQNKALTQEEEMLTISMIEDLSFVYEEPDNELTIRIYRHQEDSRSFCLLFRRGKKIACFFEDIPSTIYTTLLHHRFDVYEAKDFEIIKNLREQNLIQDETKRVRYDTSEYRSLDAKIQVRSKVYNLSKSKYLEFLGLVYEDPRLTSDEEIRELLVQYLIPGTNIVHIRANDDNYHRITRMRQVRKFPTNRSFFEYFGFDYKRMRVTDVRSQIKTKLKKYVIKGKNVYLHPFDPYYRTLYAYAYNRDEDINELIEELGYVRVYKDDLPPDATPYDWQTPLLFNGLSSDEDYRVILDELIVEDNNVYLPSSGRLYKALFLLSSRSGLSSVDELLDEWGYKRIYLRDMAKDQNLKPEAIEPEETDERAMLLEQLDKLKSIQGTLTRSTTANEKLERSQVLARQLKKVYGHRCQLCCHEKEKTACSFHI